MALEEKNLRCQVRGRITSKIYPGDRVKVADKMVEELLPRDNLLSRPQVANISRVLVVMAVKEPVLDFLLLDKFLLACELEEVEPIIIINKLDLAPDFPGENQRKLEAYRRAGYELHLISVKRGDNLPEVLKYFQEGISVLAGPSGVGKSALLNELLPEAELHTGEVSKKLGRGTHTTRRVKLLKAGDRGWVADTPGFTSLEITGIDPVDLRFYFPEFDDLTPHCKFSANCVHIHEPGCAVKKALESDKIAEHRYQSYLHFYKILEQEWENKYD